MNPFICAQCYTCISTEWSSPRIFTHSGNAVLHRLIITMDISNAPNFTFEALGEYISTTDNPIKAHTRDLYTAVANHDTTLVTKVTNRRLRNTGHWILRNTKFGGKLWAPLIITVPLPQAFAPAAMLFETSQSFAVFLPFSRWSKHGGHSSWFSRGVLFVTFWLAEAARAIGSQEPCMRRWVLSKAVHHSRSTSRSYTDWQSEVSLSHDALRLLLVEPFVSRIHRLSKNMNGLQICLWSKMFGHLLIEWTWIPRLHSRLRFILFA